MALRCAGSVTVSHSMPESLTLFKYPSHWTQALPTWKQGWGFMCVCSVQGCDQQRAAPSAAGRVAGCDSNRARAAHSPPGPPPSDESAGGPHARAAAESCPEAAVTGAAAQHAVPRCPARLPPAVGQPAAALPGAHLIFLVLLWGGNWNISFVLFTPIWIFILSSSGVVAHGSQILSRQGAPEAGAFFATKKPETQQLVLLIDSSTLGAPDRW